MSCVETTWKEFEHNEYARKNNIPFLGMCFGMQMAVIEFARNRLNMRNATSSEFGPSKGSVVGLMSEWIKDGKLMKGTDKELGGTMRLGSYEARLKKGSLINSIYKSNQKKPAPELSQSACNSSTKKLQFIIH